MKNHGLFLLSFATILFFSCSDDQGVSQKTNGTNETAVLSVSLTGAGNIQGRAAGTPTSEEESQVNDGIIYVFDAAGNVLKNAYFKSGDVTSDTARKQIMTTTAAVSVSVLLNTGVSDSASMVGTRYNVPSKRQLEALIMDLAKPDGTATQVSDNLLMSGTSVGSFDFIGTPKAAEVRVTVYRIVSKVTINWSFEPNSAFTNKIRLVGAIVLNVPSTSLLFGSPLTLASPKYLEGLPANVLSSFPEGGYKPVIGDMISNVDLLSVADFQVTPVPANHFYISENTSVSPTIVALVADYNENGIDQPTPGDNFRKYYPIVINKATTGLQDGTMTIKRNMSFNVKAVVKGVGVDNPFNPSDPASLNVVVIVADWALIVNVNQTFE